MSLTMFEATVPVLTRALNILAALLEKAARHAEAKKIDESVVVQGRLAADMFPLVRQVQIATDIIKGGCARLAGVEVPSYEDKEATFAELQARIAKTVTFIGTLKAAQFDGSETRTVTLKFGKDGDKSFKGDVYLQQFVLPNAYFHLVTSYAILRHLGVEVGKMDFLGQLDFA